MGSQVQKYRVPRTTQPACRNTYVFPGNMGLQEQKKVFPVTKICVFRNKNMCVQEQKYMFPGTKICVSRNKNMCGTKICASRNKNMCFQEQNYFNTAMFRVPRRASRVFLVVNCTEICWF